MSIEDTTIATNNQGIHGDIDALVDRWHSLVNTARNLAENGMAAEAVYQHQQALLIAGELSWNEAELFNWRHLINLLEELGQKEERKKCLHQGIAKADELEEESTKAWMCYQLSEMLWLENKTEAIYWCKSALEAAPFPEDWSAITLYYITLGRYLRDEQQHEEAAKLYQEAVQRAAEVRDTSEMLSFLLKETRTYLHQNNWDVAIMQLQTALTLPEFTDFPQKAVEVLEELGDAYYLSGLHTQAIPVFQQSLDLSRQLGDVDLQFQQLWRLASVYRASGNPLEAGEVSSEALQLARHHQMPGKAIAALRDLSKAKLMLGEQETAVILLQEAVAITADIGDNDLELDCLADLASVYQEVGLTTAATETAVAGLQLAFEYEKPTDAVQFLSILSVDRQVPLQMWNKIDELAKLVYDNCQQSEYPLALSECLPVLGGLYIERDPRQALIYYQELAELFQSEGNISRYITTTGLIASAYHHMDDFDQAIRILQGGIDLLNRQESTYLLQYFDLLLHLAILHYQAERFSESQKYLALITQKVSLEKLDIDRAFQIAEQQGDTFFAQNAYQQAENAYQSALTLLEKQFYGAASASVRLNILTAGRFIYGRVVLASLRQTINEAANTLRAFHYVETVRSRLFLSQLGQTHVRSPEQIPHHLIAHEQQLILILQMLFHQTSFEPEAASLQKQAEVWDKLQSVWQQMEGYGSEAQGYISQRRGTVIEFHKLQTCLSF